MCIRHTDTFMSSGREGEVRGVEGKERGQTPKIFGLEPPLVTATHCSVD